MPALAGRIATLPGSPLAAIPQRTRELLARGVETGIHYPIPCHRQEPYGRFAHGSLPVAERAAEEILSLPMFPHITAEQIGYVSAVLDEVVGTLDAHVA